MTDHKFASSGFLVLGVLSVAASVLFLVRAVGVEATAERIWSAVAFGVMGAFMLSVHWAARRTSNH